MDAKDLVVEFGGRPKATIVAPALAGIIDILEGLSEELTVLDGETPKDQPPLKRQAAPQPAVEWSFEGDDKRFQARLVGRGDESVIVQVIREAFEVQERILAGETTSHSDKVERGARRFMQSVNGFVKEARLVSRDRELLIDRPVAPRRSSQSKSLGGIEGKVVGLFEVDRSKEADIVVLDRAYRVRVRCRVPEALIDDAVKAWRGRARVDGMVVRDEETGAPVRVWNVTAVRGLPPIDSTLLSRVAGTWAVPAGFEVITTRELDAHE